MFQFVDNELIFKRKLALDHAAKSTKEWFRQKRQTVLDSPANPLENLQGIIKRRLSNLEELKGVVTEVWASVTLEDCHWLIGSLPQRIKEIINAKSATMKY